MSIRLAANFALFRAPRCNEASGWIQRQRRRRIAIGATVLIYGFAPASQTPAGTPTFQHAQQGDAVCGWIGVKVSPMTRAFADSLGMAEPYGAIFDQPEVGSPAAIAGIQAGDVITAINGSPVMLSSDFAPVIAAIAPNTRAYLSTFRDGQMIEVMVMVGSGKCPGEQRSGRASS
jgi:membrane-associated protease RseP (regulator of RpoE activity)